MAGQEREPPGLKSIRDARGKRERGARVTPQHILFVLLSGVTITLGYYLISARQLDAAKDKLLQKQRAIEATIGVEWKPLCDKMEKATLDAAGPYQGDFVDSEAPKWNLREKPGIYLRVRLADAKDVASLRRAAQASARDSFAGCLLREPNEALAKGIPDAGAFAEQPWNLRQAYAATRVLTEDWVSDVKAADDELRLRVFEQQYEVAAREQIPLTIDVIKRAQFFLFVLDEDADGGRPADGGAPTEESLQTVPHPARVTMIDLKTGGVVFRLRRTGQASFVLAQSGAQMDEEMKLAMARNVNNCDLAKQVQTAVDERGSAGAASPAK